MRKLLFSLCVFALSPISELFANPVPILYTTRSNKCFIGCGAVSDKIVRHDQLMDNGTLYTYYSREIKCSGLGFKGCPTMISPDEASDISTFDKANCDVLLTYAVSKIETENTPNGVHSIQVFNTDTNKQFIYTITWTAIGNNEEQTLEITKLEVQ